MHISVAIPRDPRAPARGRRLVERLRGHVAAEIVPDAKLLVSELITNSVKYGSEDQVTLKLDTTGPRSLRVELLDGGPGFVPAPRTRPSTDVGGWGLHLVRVLSDRWGVRTSPTTVWFEIDAHPRAA